MKFKTLAFTFILFSPIAFGFSCDEPAPYCKEMSSCEEAKFYLNKCGITRLDRDGDGVPCENICGKDGGKVKKGKQEKEKEAKEEQENKGAE